MGQNLDNAWARSIQPKFSNFWSKPEWIGSVQPENFEKVHLERWTPSLGWTGLIEN